MMAHHYQIMTDPYLIHQYQKLLPVLVTAVKIAGASNSYRRHFLDALLKASTEVQLENNQAAAEVVGVLVPPVLIPNPANIPPAPAHNGGIQPAAHNGGIQPAHNGGIQPAHNGGQQHNDDE
jgi:hypothetical protein